MCKMNNRNILNGRDIGKVTCKGMSAVEYGIAIQDMFNTVHILYVILIHNIWYSLCSWTSRKLQ